MAFYVKDDFKAGLPVGQVPVSWFNAVAQFINGLVGGKGVSVKKSDQGRSTISLDDNILRTEIENAINSVRVSKDYTALDDHSDTNADDDQDGSTWTWTPGNNGLVITPYCEIEEDGGFHYFGRVQLTFSKDGLLVRAEKLAGRREITA